MSMDKVMIEVNIRAADPQDIDLLADLIRRSFKDVAERFGLTPENCPKHPSNYTSDWVKRDLDRGVAYWIAEINGEPFGSVGMEKPNADMFYLERLAVLPNHRNRGHGKILVDHVLEQAGQDGAKRVGIAIIANQGELKAWYQKIGFIEGETKTFEHLPFRVTFLTLEI
jgi:ribosomal protein S18 acetylase RimI-like enzyme